MSVTVTESNVVVTLEDPQRVVVAAPGPQGARYLPPRSVTILDPTSAEDITLMWTPVEMTVASLVAHVSGSSPSVTYSIRFGGDRAAAGTEVVTGGSTTTSTTVGDEVTVLDNATIPAESWIWLTTSGSSGTVSQLHVTVIF